MRRAVLIVAAAALLGGGCARGEIAPRAAEAGAPRIALSRLETLTATVQQLLDQGKLDRDRALDILDAADDVRTQLALLPVGSGTSSSSTETPSPSPSEEDGHGNHGEGNNGNGNGGDGD